MDVAQKVSVASTTKLPVPMRPLHVGARVPRLEDDRLLRGDGRFVADLRLPGMVDVAVVRSQMAHARIQVDLSRARQAKGAVAAVSAEDLTDAAVLPEFVQWAQPVRRFMLARGVARFVGAPIAAVVATDRYLAEDAAETAAVDYEELPPVVSLDDALAPEAPRLFDDWPDNRQVTVPASDPAVDAAFAGAWKVVRGRFVVGRQAAVPMEGRGCVAEYRDGRLSLWTSTQVPHWVRTLIPYVLPIQERDVRVVAPDVGGGFGCKWHIYPEEFLVAWLAMKLGRPVRWIEDRAEHMVSSVHARDVVWDLEAAIHEDGQIAAVRGEVIQDVGAAECFPVGFGPSFTGMGGLVGSYRIPLVSIGVSAVVTNKTPSGAYRGYGLPEAQFAMERLIDRCAEAAGVDPLDLRRRMLLRSDELPHTTATGAVLDSGSYVEAFDEVAQRAQQTVAEARRQRQGDDRIRVGLGLSNWVEGTAAGGFGDTGLWSTQDSVSIRFDPDGSVTVSSGVSTAGQGVPTMLATLAADSLGVPIDRIRVVVGDTDTTPYGLGGWASRSTIVAGGAMMQTAHVLREKGLRIAAHLLEAEPEDLVIEDGAFRVAGAPDRFVSWRDVALTAIVRVKDLPPGVEPGLDASSMYRPPGVDDEPREDGRMNACPTYANGTVAAVVEVDVDTGGVRVLDYLVAHDCGTVINPVVVEGQIIGGVAQGLGGSLLEDLAYSPEGQPLATTFMDYVLPSATEVPAVWISHHESPSPNTAFGAKGMGEAGVIGCYTVVAQAIDDALHGFGAEHVDRVPISPPAVRRLIAGAGDPSR